MFQFAEMSERIQRIRAKRDAFTGGKYMTVNSERTKIYTDYCKAHHNEHPLLRRSGALLEWAKTKQYNVFDDDIFVGTPGPDERSLSPYVEWMCNWIPNVVNDDETFRQAWQTGDSISMTDADREVFRDAYEYWKDKTVSKVTEGALTDDFWNQCGTGFIIPTSKHDPNFFAIAGMPQGHYIANFNKAINTGFGTVRAQAMSKIEELRGKVFGDSARSYLFYNGVVRVCDAAILLSKNYAKACRAKAATVSDAARKAELLRMADSLDWIMENPARNYWEGLQAAIFYQLLLSTDAQQHGQSIGRIDWYTGRLLQAELDKGEITTEQAQEYTDAFILRLSDIIVLPGFFMNNRNVIAMKQAGKNLYAAIYNGLTPTAGINLTLGGCMADGTDCTTPATYLFLQTYGRMQLPDPTVALRIHAGSPEELWTLAIESNKRSGGIPQLQNDEIIVKSLMDIGLSEEDAYDYSIVGCVEPAGTGNEWPACGCVGMESIWNMVVIVPITINGGVNPFTGKMGLPCKKLYEYESFEEFKEAFAQQVKFALDWCMSYANMFELVYGENFPCIVASTLMDGCMESGKDVNHGGSKYNRIGLCACGTSNIADSLMAIKKLCFDEKTVSLKEMYDALMANWEGYEDLRQTVINDVPHYGNDIDEVDELANWALGLFGQLMAEGTNARGNFSAGTFTMTAHMRLGAVTSATPDGRKSGDPLADAISPRQGFDKNGPTAYLRSAARLPHRILSNGDQLNIRFSPTSVASEAGAKKLQQLIKTYFKLGGMQVQFNVVGTEALHKAQKDPQAYQDLIVRIAGFSTYFVSLDKKTQDDFITRTEQAI